jgi:hypothetical protein
VTERSFSWISNYRLSNAIFERTKAHLIAFLFILSEPLKRLVIEKVGG